MLRQSVNVRSCVVMCWMLAAALLAVGCDAGTGTDDEPNRASDRKGAAGRKAAAGRGGAGASSSKAGSGGSGGSGGMSGMASSDQAGRGGGPGDDDAGKPGDDHDGGVDEAAAGSGGAGTGNKAGSGGMSPSQAGTGGTAGSAPNVSCQSCQAQSHDGENFCPRTVAACHRMPGNTSADSPVRPNTPNGALCKEIVECMEAKGCAKTAATDCLCGAGVNPNTCFNGSYANMKGPCKELIAAGTETTDTTQLAMRFSDEQYPMGLAVQVIELCDQLSCLDECL